MNIEEFSQERPYLYHLTDRSNLKLILNNNALLSTKKIAHASFKNNQRAKDFLRTKREGHEELSIDGVDYKIRDQRPISMTVLGRSLSGGLDAGDFLELLNKRVFWWPNTDRLNRHYLRYEPENPVILRVKTEEMLELNSNVEFCRLNSGATRCHPTYGGNAPTRGMESFRSADSYEFNIASVAEVTFVEDCQLPQNIWIGSSPNGTWKKIR